MTPRRRPADLTKIVTMFTDGSYHPPTKRGSWAAIIFSDRGKYEGAHPMRQRATRSNEAEMAAVANALFFAVKRGLALKGDRVICYCDCEHVVRRINEEHGRQSEAEKRMEAHIRAFLDQHGLTLEMRKVKAHVGAARGDHRNGWNNYVDRLAAIARRAAMPKRWTGDDVGVR